MTANICYFYFIRFQEYFKIGITVSPKERLKLLEHIWSYENPLEKIIYTFGDDKTAQKVEYSLKYLFSKFKPKYIPKKDGASEIFELTVENIDLYSLFKNIVIDKGGVEYIEQKRTKKRKPPVVKPFLNNQITLRRLIFTALISSKKQKNIKFYIKEETCFNRWDTKGRDFAFLEDMKDEGLLLRYNFEIDEQGKYCEAILSDGFYNKLSFEKYTNNEYEMLLESKSRNEFLLKRFIFSNLRYKKELTISIEQFKKELFIRNDSYPTASQLQYHVLKKVRELRLTKRYKYEFLRGYRNKAHSIRFMKELV